MPGQATDCYKMVQQALFSMLYASIPCTVHLEHSALNHVKLHVTQALGTDSVCISEYMYLYKQPDV